MTFYGYDFASKEHISNERKKIKEAKKTRWWQLKCSKKSCYYCEKTLKQIEITMDHIIPIARGGKTQSGNVVPSCRDCNKNKGVETPVDVILESLKT
jgi:5-methylcytosine-specific restriction protein A